MTDPKITVVIPTRERADVLRQALRTVVAQDYENLEILVSDNASTDDTESVVRAVADPRVRYLNTGRRLSMSHNWEFALNHVGDGWVTIIGDDDGLLPGTIGHVAEIIRSHPIQAIRSRTCSYLWPSLTGTDKGRMYVPRGHGSEVRNSREWLGRVLRGDATYADLPMLYSGGYVRTTVLDEVRARSGGVFYRSCIPDVYSALAIASVVDRYLFVREPLAVNGASRHSTGTSQFSPGRNVKAQPAALFASEPNIPFHPDVPLMKEGAYPPSLQALVYESYLQSTHLRDAGPDTTPAEQLGIILASAGAHEAAVEEWGKRFAAMHSLSAAGVVAYRPQTPRRRVSAAIQRFKDRVTLRRLGSARMPIRDVYAAAVAAGPVTGRGRRG